MKRTSTALALAAAVAALRGITAEIDRTSGSAMMARRRLQSDSETIPVVGIIAFSTGGEDSAAGGDASVSGELEEELTERLEEDEQVTGERNY